MTYERPDDSFRYQHHPITTAAGGCWRLTVPAAAAIGWIPFHGVMPASLSQQAAEALARLVTLGNDPPPGRLTGPGEFVSFVDKKDFRAALALDEIHVSLDGAGAFTSVSFYQLIRCGYTPIPPRHQLIYLGWTGLRKGKGNRLTRRDQDSLRTLVQARQTDQHRCPRCERLLDGLGQRRD